MKWFSVVVCLLLAQYNANGQEVSNEVIASGGASFESQDIQLSWTLGELMTESYGNDLRLTQGFHQAFEFSTSIHTFGDPDWNALLFPNPAYETMHLQTSANEQLTARIIDLNGKVRDIRKLSEASAEWQVGHLLPGWYTVELIDERGNRRLIVFEKF